MANMKVNVCGVDFKNPVIAASGSYGFGREYNEFYDIGNLGGISVKGLTLKERAGNPPPRVAETPAGMLNSVGLQNPGVDSFIKNDLSWLKQKGVTVVANIAGSTIEDYCEMAWKLSNTDVDMIEMNISCPNVKKGGAAFGTDKDTAAEVTKAVRAHCTKPLMVKLSPNVTDIVSIAKAIEAEGADALSLINTLLGMRIDIKTRRPILHQNVGGLSGPAVFPIAVRMVWQVSNNVDIPVVGLGGIYDGATAIEMMMAGASAIQVGTANFTDPYAMMKIISDMEEFLDKNNIADINEIVGQVKPY